MDWNKSSFSLPLCNSNVWLKGPRTEFLLFFFFLLIAKEKEPKETLTLEVVRAERILEKWNRTLRILWAFDSNYT